MLFNRISQWIFLRVTGYDKCLFEVEQGWVIDLYMWRLLIS